MSERYPNLVGALRRAVLEGAGASDPALRRAVEARGQGAAGDAAAGVPANLVGFVDKVAHRAFDVRQEDVDALRRAGYSEDAIFEITASAALGAGLSRLERGLGALRGAR